MGNEALSSDSRARSGSNGTVSAVDKEIARNRFRMSAVKVSMKVEVSKQVKMKVFSGYGQHRQNGICYGAARNHFSSW